MTDVIDLTLSSDEDDDFRELERDLKRTRDMLLRKNARRQANGLQALLLFEEDVEQANKGRQVWVSTQGFEDSEFAILALFATRSVEMLSTSKPKRFSKLERQFLRKHKLGTVKSPHELWQWFLTRHTRQTRPDPLETDNPRAVAIFQRLVSKAHS